MTRLQAKAAAAILVVAVLAMCAAQAPVLAQVPAPLAGHSARAALSAPQSAETPAPEIRTDALRNAYVEDVEGSELGAIVDFVLEPSAAAAVTEGDALPDPDQISHVVLEIGGVMGLGRHTVAVPYSELQIVPGEDGHLRISLPWTETQLRSVPAWNPDDPATLGLSGPTSVSQGVSPEDAGGGAP